jgi:hypothetical protein
MYCEKLLNLQKAFENRRDRLWLAFKIGELHGSGRLSKSASWLWPAFKIAKLVLAGSRKLSAQLRERFELAGFRKLFANSKSFWAKRVKYYLIQYKIKGTLTKIMNICRTLS